MPEFTKLFHDGVVAVLASGNRWRAATGSGTVRGMSPGLRYSVGMIITKTMQDAILQVSADGWTPLAGLEPAAAQPWVAKESGVVLAALRAHPSAYISSPTVTFGTGMYVLVTGSVRSYGFTVWLYVR